MSGVIAFLPKDRVPATNGGEPSTMDLSKALIGADELSAMELPSREPLLGHWMKEGDLGFVFAPRGAGKTWMAMLIGNAVATATDLGEWSAGGSPRLVTYFDAEMNLADVKERGRQLGIDSPSFRWLSNERMYEEFETSLNIADRAHQDALSELLEDGSFLIIDNLSTSQLNMAENDNDAFDQIKTWLLDLRRRRVTVLIVHHAGRNGNMRGGSRREDMAHWIISLKEEWDEDSHAKVFTTSFEPPKGKCRNCPHSEAPPLRWSLQDKDGRLVYSCQRHSGKDRLLPLICDGFSSATELADLLEVAKGTISKWAKKLEQDGLIRNDRGKYYPVESDK